MLATEREYISSADLAAEISTWLQSTDSNYHQLARRAAISPRLLRFIFTGQRRYQNIFIADRLMTAMGKYIYHLPIYYRSTTTAGNSYYQPANG